MISRLIFASKPQSFGRLASSLQFSRLSRRFSTSSQIPKTEKTDIKLTPELREAVEEQKSALKITYDDISLTLYQVNPIFKNAFFMLKWQLIFAMLGFAAFFLREIFELLDKTEEFEERNVEFILKNCKAAGVDPLKEFPTSVSRESIK